MRSLALAPACVAELVRAACELEVRAFKPGNVSVASPGHGMHAELFISSAAAMAGPLTRPEASVGERILDAVAATNAVAGCNTNLGIVLLLAPLVEAVLADATPRDLRTRLRPTLAALSVADARDAYAAIRLASPGGLGNSESHDVRRAPSVTLLVAMQAAAGHDRIAHQYATAFADVFDFGVPLAERALRRFASDEWATVAVFLGWLARFPDTHIVRKHGADVAETVRREAVAIEAGFAASPRPEDALPQLRQFDFALKARGINPGTSADLTVATLVARQLQDALDHQVDCRPASLAGRPLSPAGLCPRVF